VATEGSTNRLLNISTTTEQYQTITSTQKSITLHTTHTMLFSIPLLALLATHLTSVTQAAPLPQSDVSTNAPAGPPITDLSASLGDLVIPQEEHSNDTAPATKKERSQPMDFSRLVQDIGDLRLPSNVTASSVAKAAK